MLTDFACSNLAHTLPPRLKLVGIGWDLYDNGLLTLLRMTPLLRRLDLEDSPSITSAVHFSLTLANDRGMENNRSAMCWSGTSWSRTHPG